MINAKTKKHFSKFGSRTSLRGAVGRLSPKMEPRVAERELSLLQGKIPRRAKGYAGSAGNGASPPASAAETNETRSSHSRTQNRSGFDLTEKLKELVALAQEQGYLTYGDINDALPDELV